MLTAEGTWTQSEEMDRIWLETGGGDVGLYDNDRYEILEFSNVIAAALKC